jgi:hypothetical protein
MCATVNLTCCDCPGLHCAAADATNKSLEATLQETHAASAGKDRELQEALAQLVRSCCYLRFAAQLRTATLHCMLRRM